MNIRWNVIGYISFVKVCIAFLIVIAYTTFPFNTTYYLPNFIYPRNEALSLKTAFKTWDAQHFLFLSEKGYQHHIDSNAFAPLYPFSLFLLNGVTKDSFVSGLIASTVYSFVGFYLFFLLVEKWYNTTTAYKSLFFLLCFPTSFFFSLLYSESLFFLCLMLFFFFLSKKKLFLASLMALLIPTVRLVGIFISIPFVSWYIFEYHKLTLYTEVAVIGRKLLRKDSLFLLSPLLGLGLVMSYFFFTTGNAFAQLDAQKQFVSHYSILSFFNPFLVVRSLFHFPLALHGFTNSLLDRVFFLGFLFLLFVMRKRISLTFFVVSVVFGVLPVLGGSFMSYMRYLAVVFPLYIALAKVVDEKKYAFLEFPLLFLFVLLQTLFIIMHSLNYWVA